MNFIFDLYGTLVDIKTNEESVEFWQNIAIELDEDITAANTVRKEYLSACAGYKLADEQEIDLLRVFEDLLALHGKDRRNAKAFAEKFRELSTEKISVFDGVPRMLCDLKAFGAGVYLISNAQSCFTLPELDRLGLLPLFDGIVISSDAGIKKPSTKIFELALAHFGTKPDECIYVGNDMRDDILGATQAGLRTAYIHTEQSGNYDGWSIPSPTYTARDHDHLSQILLGIANK